jgi:hypothetical protein
MSNLLVNHAGGDPAGYDVPHTGIKVFEPFKSCKLAVFTNASDEPIYLALKGVPDNTSNEAIAGAGIYLTPRGGAYEMNNTNMGYCQVWAIHADVGNTHRLCVQVAS